MQSVIKETAQSSVFFLAASTAHDISSALGKVFRVSLAIFFVDSGNIGVFFERMWDLSGILFTKHFIESVFVQTNKLICSISNVTLKRQTCGQHSSMAARSKRRAPSIYFPMWICHMFLISKCRREWNLGMCTFPVLQKKMLLQCAHFWRPLRPNAFLNWKNVLQARFCDWIFIGSLFCWCSSDSLFKIVSSESDFYK